MSLELSRVIEEDKISEYAEAIISIFSVPRVIERVDAITVFPGLGEWWRVRDAIESWEKPSTVARHLLVAGYNNREVSYEELTLERLRKPPYILQKEKGFRYTPHAEHTKEQTDWVVTQAQSLDIQSLALFVSPYHMTRAYLTLLKSFLVSDLQIPLIPMPVRMSPDTQIPDTKVEAWQMVPGEMQRIGYYQDAGHVATFAELRAYLARLWQQPILQ